MKYLRFTLLLKTVTALALVLNSHWGLAQDQLRTESPDYWMQSEVPLLGQLIPVNQINLQKGVHLLDLEMLGKKWEGMTNPFDTMGLGSFSTQNQEALFRVRYAYPLARYTYVGISVGFATRWEAELYDESGITDPEIFVGHHIPWRNGDFRLGFTFSPSLGVNHVERDITLDDETAKGNFYRGGWSARPEAALTIRTGKVLFGAEGSYLYFGDRTQDEFVSVSPEALNDPSTYNGLSQHFLGVDSYNQGYGSGYDATVFQDLDYIQNKISGGHTWAIKGLLEIPEWQRLGAEVIYGQVGTSQRENDFGKVVENEGGEFQEIRVYGRYKYSDKMSLTPLFSWMPSLPLVRGQERMDSTSNVWGVQLTFRSKFEL
jgi:hypothetical protein